MNPDDSDLEQRGGRAGYHILRFLPVLLVAILVPVLFPRASLPEFALLEEGMVAPEDVIADSDFAVPKSPARLQAERREAERGVAPIFVLDTTAADSAVARVRNLLDQIETAIASGVGPDTQAVRTTLNAFGIHPTPEQSLELTDPARRRALSAALQSAYESLLPQGVASISDVTGVTSGQVVIRGPREDRMVARDSLLTVGGFYERVAGMAPRRASAAGIQLYQILLRRFITPSLRPDARMTEAAKAQAREAVDTTADFVLAGERIISAHERVSGRDIERLKAYQAQLQRRGMAGGTGSLLRNLGSVLYALLVLGVLAAALRFFRPRIYAKAPDYLLVILLVAVVLGAASVIARTDYPPALVPIAFAALLLGALYDGLVALVTVMVIAALIGGQTPFTGISIPFLLTAGGAAAAIAVPGIRRRAQNWILIALIAAAYAVGGVALALMRSLPASEVLSVALWGAINAFGCTVLAMGAMLPALEKITGIITDQTLLELTDLNAPLLRELSRKAPGTYAHSISVANLAESACQAIGANPLLARVGVYYHDIGKMERPQYFVENQPSGRNPHDLLPPAESASIILGHVQDGVRLAAEHRLPQQIRNFICEHHGTQAISYFLDKARDQNDEVAVADFVYPGPKPRSRETAIAMLADGVESAARVLPDPTPEHIRELIDRIVQMRIEDGQLDECPLTLRDIEWVKRQFAHVLLGMYHRRIDYPSGIHADDTGGEVTPGSAGAAEE